MADPRIQVVVDAVDRASDKISQFKDRASGNMEEVARTARKAGVAMTAMGGAGMIASKKLTDRAIEVEEAYANVSTMMEEGQRATDVYKESVRELTTSIATQGGEIDNINALYQILSASITDAEEATAVLETAMKTATAGVTDTEVAVDAMTTILNAYNMEASEADRVSDVLFGTVRRGKVRFEELAQSIGMAVPVASEMGVTIEELNAMIATLTRNGLQAGRASTYLRQTMSQILSPSSAMADAIEELGYESGSAMVEQEGLASSLQMLYEHVGESQEGMAELIPSTRALSAVMSLVGEGAQDVQEDLEELRESSGTMEEAYSKQAETMAGETRKVNRRLEEVRATLGESTGPAMLRVKEITASNFNPSKV